MKLRDDLSADQYERIFDHGTDRFGKAGQADRMTKLFSRIQHGTVSILDGRWGTGKTTFVRGWKCHLERNGIPCIYFDAFAADYVDSPFQAVASAFLKAARGTQSKDDARYKRLLEASARSLKAAAPALGKMVAKVATLGVVGAAEVDGLKDALDEVASGVGDMSEKAVEKMLEAQNEDEASFEALKRCLSELPSLLATRLEQSTATQGNQPSEPSLIVIIDELDRCRPDFALGMLEALKHFFGVERIHFVLVTNISHLELSVQKRYGVADAAGEYLQKFYDFVIHFEEAPKDRIRSNASVHAKILAEKLLPLDAVRDRSNFLDNVAMFVDAYGLTLRQAERAVTNVLMAHLGNSAQDWSVLVAFLAVVKALRPDVFSIIKHGDMGDGSIAAFISQPRFRSEQTSERMNSYLRYFCDASADVNAPEFDRFKDGNWAFHFDFTDRLEAVRYVANNIIDG